MEFSPTELIYNEPVSLITDFKSAEILYEDGTQAVLIQDDQGNLFIPTEGQLLINEEDESFVEQEEQVIYYSEDGVQLVEYENENRIIDQEQEQQEMVVQYKEELSGDESNNYQYTALEDGDNSENILNYFQTDLVAGIAQIEETKTIDISEITGRNLITGQTITLDNYIDKIIRKNDNEILLNPFVLREKRKVSSGKKLIGRIIQIIKQQNKIETKGNKNIMSRDTYNYVSRMLSGLMTMESVNKKLCDKNLKIKVVKKNFMQEKSKVILRLCGYMTRTLTGNWKFMPIKQINDDYKSVEVEGFNERTFSDKIHFESTSLTLIISIEKNGSRSMRVNLTPTNLKKYMKQLKCEFCEKIFKDKTQLEKHKQLHCNICGKYFTFQVHLRQHLHQEHNNFKAYQCGVCNIALDSVAEFNIHFKTHAVTRTFECGICGREFSRHSNLVRHVAIHKGGATYQCEICGCTYNFVSSLTRHMVQKHIKSSLSEDQLDQVQQSNEQLR